MSLCAAGPATSVAWVATPSSESDREDWGVRPSVGGPGFHARPVAADDKGQCLSYGFLVFEMRYVDHARNLQVFSSGS